MKKIKLNLEELRVNSFATAQTKKNSGTVNGYTALNDCLVERTKYHNCFSDECASFRTEGVDCYTTMPLTKHPDCSAM